MKEEYDGYYGIKHVLRCCEEGNNSDLIARWKEDKKISIAENQDEYDPQHEPINFCPFCGKEIQK